MAQSEIPKQGCIVARTISGNSPEIRYIPEGRSGARQWVDTELAHGVAADTGTSTGAPKSGAMVYMNSSQVLECWPGDMAATGYDVLQYKLVGLLLEDVTESATGLNKVAVAIANSDTQFETSLVSETATTTATVTATLIGLRMSCSVTGSAFYLDRTSDTPTHAGTEPFIVTDVIDDDGTLYGRVQFMARQGLFFNTELAS